MLYIDFIDLLPIGIRIGTNRGHRNYCFVAKVCCQNSKPLPILACYVLILPFFTVFGSTVTLGEKLAPAGSSYLPPTAASTGYGSPQATYGNDDYYDDYQDQQPAYSEPEQVKVQEFYQLHIQGDQLKIVKTAKNCRK